FWEDLDPYYPLEGDGEVHRDFFLAHFAFNPNIPSFFSFNFSLILCGKLKCLEKLRFHFIQSKNTRSVMLWYLEEQTIKLIQEMPITYDITTDYVFKKGMEKGMEKGIKKGKVEGKTEEKMLIAQNWLLSKSFLSGALTYEDIAASCGISVEQVKEIHRQLTKEKGE
ncbi:MAG: hypothetical protein AAF694_25385, partial [Bacteroidota bacterium]